MPGRSVIPRARGGMPSIDLKAKQSAENQKASSESKRVVARGDQPRSQGETGIPKQKKGKKREIIALAMGGGRGGWV